MKRIAAKTQGTKGSILRVSRLTSLVTNHRRFSAALSAALVGVVALGAYDIVDIRHSNTATAAGNSARPVTKAKVLSGHVQPDTTQPHTNPLSTRTVDIAGFTQKTLTVSGIVRHYYVQTPTNATRPAPLVIALHGLNSTPTWIANSTGLAAAAKASNVALVVPVTNAGAWNDGRLGTNGPDDEAFVLAIVNQAVKDKLADPKRVVIAGFSNGAEMSLTMASRYPQTFAAVVSVAGELPSARAAARAAARPTAPIPAYFVHGLADKIQPYEGRMGNGKLFNGLMSEQETVDAFVRVNGAGTAKTAQLPHGPDASGPIEEVVYAAGPDNAPVTLYKLPGVGHKWPASISHQGVNDNVAAAGFSATNLIIKAATTQSR